MSRQPAAASAEKLQHGLDRFRAYYNADRPHRALGRRTPAQAYAARPKASPSGVRIPMHYRVRRDRIDGGGAVTLRHDSRLHHIKVGRRHAGSRVLMLVAAVVDRLAPGRVLAAFAEDWELGNGASLAAAELHLAGEDLFMLVRTDHIFGDGALAALARTGGAGVLVDHAPDAEAWAEGTRVLLHEERAVAFSKELEHPSIDCGAFLLPLDVFDAQRRVGSRGDGSLAGAVTELARSHPLAAVPLPRGAWWQDVEPEDLRRVSRTLRRSLTKEADGPVSRYLNRPVSTRISMRLAHLPIHPDAVSIVAFLVALLAAWSLGLSAAILGAILVHVASVLDGVDGETARLQVRASPGGALLDGVLDRLADAAVIAGLAVWALESGGRPASIVLLAVAATTGSILSMASKDRVAALRIPPAPERWIGFLLGGRDARLLLVAIGALLGRPEVVLAAVAITSGLSLAVRLLFTRAALRAWSGAP